MTRAMLGAGIGGTRVYIQLANTIKKRAGIVHLLSSFQYSIIPIPSQNRFLRSFPIASHQSLHPVLR